MSWRGVVIGLRNTLSLQALCFRLEAKTANDYVWWSQSFYSNKRFVFRYGAAELAMSKYRGLCPEGTMPFDYMPQGDMPFDRMP